eukprot:5070273-Pleurochrysis_carterae.AAC.1
MILSQGFLHVLRVEVHVEDLVDPAGLDIGDDDAEEPGVQEKDDAVVVGEGALDPTEVPVVATDLQGVCSACVHLQLVLRAADHLGRF